jgi:hypothetical protein
MKADEFLNDWGDLLGIVTLLSVLTASLIGIACGIKYLCC